MNIEKLQILSKIYNTLLLVNTKGEDTMVMADCLKALRDFILTNEQEIKNTEEE